MVISRVISALNGATLIIILLITNLLSPLALQVNPKPESLSSTHQVSGAFDEGVDLRHRIT